MPKWFKDTDSTSLRNLYLKENYKWGIKLLFVFITYSFDDAAFQLLDNRSFCHRPSFNANGCNRSHCIYMKIAPHCDFASREFEPKLKRLPLNRLF